MKQKEIDVKINKNKQETRHSREGEIRSKTCFFRRFQEKVAFEASKMVLTRKKQVFNKQEPKLLKLAQQKVRKGIS